MQKLFLVVFFFLSISIISAQEYKTPEELADPTGQFATVNGASIYYIARGESNNPAVILIHGFGGSTVTWRDNMDAIAEAGFYVVALDLPPFGLSDKSPDIGYTRRDMANTVVGLMDVLEIETATIVGHSMGGSVTAYLAVEYPERIDKLIFVAGAVFSGETTDNENQGSSDSPFSFLANIDPESPSAAQFLRIALRPSTFAQIMTSAYYDETMIQDDVVAGYARPLQIENWTYGFLAYLQAEETNPVTVEHLTDVNIAALVLWGEEDTWVSIKIGMMLNEILPNSTMISYEKVGHLPMEENIAQFNADVITFLQSD